jgi:hypothetical protein
MSHHPRRLAPLALTPVLAVTLLACSSGAAQSPAPSTPPSSGPSAAPSDSPSGTPVAGGVEHKTGATDILLRYDEGGGFMIAGYSASQAPPFTLFGDGTVIFRNGMLEGPAPQGSVMTFNPMRTAKLSEEQIQELLVLALGDGGLAAARPNYDNPMVTDVGTTIFTVDAGGIKKTVSIYALGFDDPSSPDAAARTAFKKLADRLADFDQGGSIATDVYTPEAYRATLIDSPGIAAPDIRDWPWTDLTVADFKPDADPNGLQFPHKTMTTEEIALLGVKDFEGGFNGLVLRGTDNKLYTLALRPLLPDDEG